ncbi:MAG: hypothetical protein ABIT08_06380 [Bacteroidia bacterium]
MKKNFVIFFIKLLVYSFTIFLFYSFIKDHIPQKFYFAKAIYLIVFFIIVTLVFHYGLLNSSQKSNRSIVTFYMMATALKLFLYLGIIIGYGLLKTGNSIAFISNFFILYVLFTVFEVATVYFQFKNKNLVTGEPDQDQV